MELLSIVAIGLISGLTVSALILYLCYHLCSRKKRPRWQSKILPTPYEEYIPMIPPPKPTSVVVSNVQPPAHPDGTTTGILSHPHNYILYTHLDHHLDPSRPSSRHNPRSSSRPSSRSSSRHNPRSSSRPSSRHNPRSSSKPSSRHNPRSSSRPI